MLDILEFIFRDPWHFIGFIILWWALVSPFHIHIGNKEVNDDVNIPLT